MSHKPTPAQIQAAAGKGITDVIAPNLKVLFCGINPGLYTAAVGFHFGRPGNRFWRALNEGGFTPRQYDPSEERKLLKLGYGITNLVNKATLLASELSKEEFQEGKEVLVQKVQKYRPEWLAVLGVTSYRTAFGEPRAQISLQEKTIGQTRIWLLPNPSGLNAHFTPARLAAVFRIFNQYSSR